MKKFVVNSIDYSSKTNSSKTSNSLKTYLSVNATYMFLVMFPSTCVHFSKSTILAWQTIHSKATP